MKKLIPFLITLLCAANIAYGQFGGGGSVNCSDIYSPYIMVSNQCNVSVLSTGGLVSTVSTYYWQGTDPNGTSTSNSSASYNVTSSGTYYIRAQSNSDPSCWAPASSITVSVIKPTLPPLPTVNDQCNKSVLTIGSAPSGYTYYWQGKNSSGTSTSNSSSSYNATSSGTYYVRARSNQITSCWGPSRSVSVSVVKPILPPTPTVSDQCNKSVLTIGSAPSGYTYYWQGKNSSGTSTSNSSSSYNATSSGTYYVRARSNQVTSCWGPARSVAVTIVKPPLPPTPTVSDQCNVSILSTGGFQSPGYTFYWQGTNSNGTSTSNSSSSYNATSSGTYYIRARSNDNASCWGPSRSVSVSVVKPTLPPTPSVSDQCNKSVLTIGSAPSGYTYYWQGKNSSGTSTSNSSSSYNATSSGTYYVRARSNEITSCWGPARSVSVSVVKPAMPPTPSVSDQCNKSVLTIGSAPSGYTYYWQGKNSSGTSTSNSSSSYNATSSGTYYVRARSNQITSCWGPARSVGVTVIETPLPPTPTVSDQCNESILSMGGFQSPGYTFYWQGTNSNGTSTSNSSDSYSVSSSGTYYIRARSDDNASCWGPSRSVSVSVVKPTLPPTPTVSDQCNKSVLTIGSAPSGYTYYWQGKNSSGTSTSNSSSSYNATSSGTYYVRARSNQITSCWGPSRSVSVSVVKPTLPPTPSVSDQCNKSVLTIGSAPSGYTYYWQGKNSSGTSTSNSSGTYNATSSGTYYVRARSNQITSCWGPARSVGVTVIEPPLPPAPTVSDQCNESILSMGGFERPGYTFYWQGTNSNGTSTSNSSDSYSVSSSGTYYIRARSNDITSCWGPSRSVSVSVIKPATPSMPTVSDQCNNSVLTIGSAPSGYTFYWQGTNSSGTSTSHSSSSYNATSSGTYYVRARSNQITSCWGPARAVSVTVVEPMLPPVPSIVDECNSSEIIIGSAPSGYTYYWQGTDSSGTNTSNSSSSQTVSNSGTYYVRARSNDITSCWGPARSVSVTVVEPIMPPVPSVNTQCDQSVLSIGSAPNGFTYYWQGTNPNGTSISNSLSTYTVTTSGEYYIRAKSNNVANCWSSATAINVEVVNSASIEVDGGEPITIHEFEQSYNLVGTGESPSGGTFSSIYVTNGKFNALQSGIGQFEVIYTYLSPVGCTVSDIKYVNVIPNPSIVISGTNDIVWGENKTLSVPTGFTSYQWYRNSNLISGANSRQYTVSAPGSYYVQIESENGSSLAIAPANMINSASSQNENLVQTITYRTAKMEGDVVSTIDEASEKITYFDGLGRDIQTVMTQASPAKNDLIMAKEYDEFGRISKGFLPYIATQNNGHKNSQALRGTGNNYAESEQFYFYKSPTSEEIPTTIYPFAETVYEKSPLNRPIAQFAPGDEWAADGGAKAIATEYLINSDADQIMRFQLNGDTLEIFGQYNSGVFEKIVTTDENGNQSITFTDAFNKTILKRNIADSTNFDTYYVYDLYDNLRFVIPPEAIHQLTSNAGQFPTNLLDNFVFQYRYDDRNRMEWKKVPGAEPVIMIYDDRDRLVLTQDGNQAINNLFSFTKYDALNRPIMTGEKQINISIPNLRDTLSGDDWLQNYTAFETLSGSKFGYTSNSLPKTLALNEIYTVTYYDNYDFRSEISLDGSEFDFINNGMNNAFQQTDSVKGQVTGSLTRVLNTSEMLASVNYYDQRYRLLQNIREQKGNKLITTSNSYDFVGNVLNTISEYQVNNDIYTISKTFDYDHADRLVKVWHQINGNTPILMISNQYNELGELINKKLHEDGDNFAQSIDYRYNIRGWLTRINQADLSADDPNEKTDLFGMELGYTDTFGLTVEAQYNGNITAVKWGGKRNDLEAENVLQQNAYGYGYDGLNRITEADFYESAAQTTSQKYQLRIHEYDRNGNIKVLQRKDASGNLMDSLTYDYDGSGNQLNYVSDAVTDSSGFIDGNTSGNDYTYDDNGNMISDANKGIDSIKYNNLNLPEEVSFANGNKIVYFYDASGAKLRQEVYMNNTVQKATDYIGSLILENDILQFIQTAEGRVVPKTVDGVDKNEYQYHLKDHLGNVRSTFAVRDDDFAADFEKVLVDGVMRHYNPYFNNYDTITILNNPLKRSGNYTHRLAGGGSDVVGLMKTLYVSKGDKVSAEVYGKYLDAQFSDEAINGGALINALVTMLGGGAISGEGTVVQNNLNSDYISAAMADGSQESSPKAYLNYILFDKNFSYLNSGFERLAASAADPGDGSGTHQKLSFEEIQIEEDGYLMVFLSNESQQEVEVFWDDFKVGHHYNAVLQADDYYPFGLTFNSYQRSDNMGNNYKYNGKEEQEETGWLDYGARMYQAELGRWNGVDPLAIDYHQNSPYHYALNNPIYYRDPDGRKVVAHDEDDQNAILGYLADQFGGSDLFSFNKKGVLRTNKKSFKKAKKGFSDDQNALADGLTEVIDSEDITIEVQLNESSDEFTADVYEPGFAKDENGAFVMENGVPKREGWQKTGYQADINTKSNGGALFWSPGKLAKTKTQAYGYLFMNQKTASELQLNAKDGKLTTPSASSVFMHELLDHGLDFVRNRNVNKSNGNSVENVRYHNHALKNISKGKSPLRTSHHN